jgi:hypothetical protein
VLTVAVGWTILMVAFAVVLAVQAAASVVDGEQACFFSYPTVACPSNDDPAVMRLTFAFFGIPAIWLIGIGIAILSSWWGRRRHAPGRR